MNDFTKLEDAAIVEFVCEHFSEFAEDDDSRARTISEAMAHRGTILEKRPFGFAVIHPVGSTDDRGTPRGRPVLWYLYVTPTFRGKGLGEAFVRELLGKYATEKEMDLLCHGPKREAFFKRCGFSGEPDATDGWCTLRSTL